MLHAVRVLLPHPGEEPLEEVYTQLDLPELAERPFVYVNMVATADGAAHIGGRTGGMGGVLDRAAFRRLREYCDVVLVGAGTVRAEGYGPARLPPEAQDRRRQRGLAPTPRIAVVSTRLDLQPQSRLFSHPSSRPVVITTEDADPDGRRALEEVAEVVVCGKGLVDLACALAWLRERGVRWVLCEGGPQLFGHLLAAGLVDQLFLTVAPLVVGGQAGRIVTGSLPAPARLELRELRAYGSELLARYAVVR